MYAVGTVLAGKYRIERILGEGGMGVVLAAHHIHLDIPVALKVLHADATDADRIERFLREARASAQLKGENVCRVMDVGILDDGMPHIVMEQLVGNDLQTMLKTEGPLPAATACDCILQASIALAEAHAAGIVHRDLKPGNLFWTQRPDGTRLIKVLDFGVAKASKSTFSLTQTMTMIGSPGYMSPEQLRSSKDVDSRTDIWALGVVLYQLVSGNMPFVANSIGDLGMLIETAAPPPLVGVVAPLENVILRCLEKNAANRYQNVGELASALAPFAGEDGRELATAVKRVLKGGSVAVVHTQRMSDPTTLRAATAVVEGSGPGRTLKLTAVMGLSAAAIAAAVFLLTSQMRKSAESSAAPAAEPASETRAMPVINEPRPPEPAPVAAPAPVAVAPVAAEPAPVEQAAPIEPPALAVPSTPDPAPAAETPPDTATAEPPDKPAETKKATAAKKLVTHKAVVKKVVTKPPITKTVATTTKATTTTVAPKTTIEEVSESRH